MKKIRFLFFAAIALLAVSCGKEGPEGSANVTVKKIATPTAWASGSYLGQTVNTQTITDADITSTLLEKGMVLYYLKLFGQWYNLPLIWQSGTEDQFVVNTTSLGQINLFAWSKTAGVVSGLSPASDSSKYILIYDRSITSGRVRDISKLSYEDACAVLGVQP